jgi:hypothetical protein
VTRHWLVVATLALALVGALGDDAAADTPKQRFADLKKRILAAKEKELEERRQQPDEPQVPLRLEDVPDNTAVTTRALDPDTAGNASSRTSAGIKTDLEGVEAGVSLNPGVLLSLNNNTLRELSISIASLDDSRSRFGLAWSREIAPTLLTPASVGLAPCKVDLPSFAEELDRLESSFETVCERVVQIIPQPANQPEVWFSAQIACGYKPKQDGNDPGLTEAIDGIGKVVEGARDPRVRGAMLASKAFYDDLMAFKPLDPTSCYGEKALQRGYAQTAWAAGRHRIGLSANIDLLPRVFGFNPDPDMTLPDGDVQAWKARAEYAFARRGNELAISAGYGRSRATANDELSGTLSTSLSFTGLPRALTGEPLETKGRLNIINGKLPAHFALGASVRADFAMSPPASQDTFLHLSALEAALFVDFHVTDELSFRLGIPVKGEIVVRDADAMASPPVEEKRALQWTLQPFVATVLKI